MDTAWYILRLDYILKHCTQQNRISLSYFVLVPSPNFEQPENKKDMLFFKKLWYIAMGKIIFKK